MAYHLQAGVQKHMIHLTPRQIAGQRGGHSTYTRHGQSHMETIGRIGFYTTMERYHGSVSAYMAFLRECKVRIKEAQFRKDHPSILFPPSNQKGVPQTLQVSA